MEKKVFELINQDHENGNLEFEKSDDNGQLLRCLCNRLICVYENNVIEIKCGKCKRVIRIFVEGITNITYK